MNATNRILQQFILRVLRAAGDSPMADESLRAAVGGTFLHLALTESDLGAHIKACEEKHLISGTNDDVFGLMWQLTVKGRIAAQQLP